MILKEDLKNSLLSQREETMVKIYLITQTGCPACESFLHDKWPFLKPFFKGKCEVIEVDMATTEEKVPKVIEDNLTFVPQMFVLNDKETRILMTPKNYLNSPESYEEIKQWAIKCNSNLLS